MEWETKKGNLKIPRPSENKNSTDGNLSCKHTLFTCKFHFYILGFWSSTVLKLWIRKQAKINPWYVFAYPCLEISKTEVTVWWVIRYWCLTSTVDQQITVSVWLWVSNFNSKIDIFNYPRHDISKSNRKWDWDIFIGILGLVVIKESFRSHGEYKMPP